MEIKVPFSKKTFVLSEQKSEKIGGTSQVEFADDKSGTSRIKRTPDMFNELGVVRKSALGLFNGEESRLDSISIEGYRKMRQNDGTVNALYSILTLPILASDWDIVADEELDPDGVVAKLVKDNLTLPPHKGGMTTPFNLVLADMLRAIIEGYRGFEKVFKLNADGKLVYKKLAPRDAMTITIRRDDKGGFDGFTQRTLNGTSWVDVFIPKEKCFLFTFGKDKEWLQGESAFKSAYYHYDKKHKLYYLANLAIQISAIPPRLLRTPANADEDVIAMVEEAVDSLGVRMRATIPDGFELDWADLKNKIVDPLPHIQHHNEEMARSVLAQFILLGGNGSKGGSYALSQDHSDILVMGIKGLMNQIEEHINSYLIPDLVDLNFANGAYPEFHFSDITDSTKQLLSQAYVKLIEKDKLPEYVVKGISEKMANELDIEVPEDDEIDNETKKPEETPEIDPNEVPEENNDKKVAPKLADIVGDMPRMVFPWHRELTQAEKLVRFDEIEKEMITAETNFSTKAQKIFDKIRNNLVEQVSAILNAGTVESKALDSLKVDPTLASEYLDLITSTMLDGIQYGKQSSAGELKVKIPANTADTKVFVKEKAKAIADKQFTELISQIKMDILAELRRNTLSEKMLGLGDIIGKVFGNFDAFSQSKINVTGAIIVSEAINRGRDEVYKSSAQDIAVYQYSAILDHATCPICADLDMSVVDQAEYDRTTWIPPIHANCRCIWVAIKEDQTEIPDTTGFPDSPGGADSPLLSEANKKVNKLENSLGKAKDVIKKLAGKVAILEDKAIEEAFDELEEEEGENGEGK